jgi:CDP-4-dehydro-6-deoxyglucose reductase
LPSGAEFLVEGTDNLLDAALRSGLPLQYGCSNGNCGACMARKVVGELLQTRSHDYRLSERQRADGFFLMCCHTGRGDLVIEAGEQSPETVPEQIIPVRINQVESVGNTRILHLVTPRSQRLQFLAGQRALLQAEQWSGIYSLASCPCDDRHLEFHIDRDGSAFADFVFNELRKDQVLQLKGPAGRFVLDKSLSRPILLIAVGTSFAPVKSLIQQLFNLEFSEPIHLIWYAAEGEHYLPNLPRSWADAIDNFSFELQSYGNDVHLRDALQEVVERFSTWDIYLAASSALTEKIKQFAISRNLSITRWHFESNSR